MRRALLALPLVACSFNGVPPGGGADANGSDGGADIDGSRADGANNGCADWSPVHFDPCEVGGPMGAPAGDPLPPPTWDGTCIYRTGPGTIECGGGSPVETGQVVVPQDGMGPDLAVVYFESVALPDTLTLRVLGPNPLVIASRSTLFVEGNINVASARTIGGETLGPGSVYQDHCGGNLDGNRGGGGGGGGFGEDGADGADGQDGSGGSSGGNGGNGQQQPPTLVLPGCDGGRGEEQGEGAFAGARGAGGGALVLAAQTAIDVSGTLYAAGMGGGGGRTDDSGGGGGGAGGLIVFDAPAAVIDNGAIVAANGGGGGEGGASPDGQNEVGTDGTNGLPSINAAAGGSGGAAGGGSGGDGGALSTSPATGNLADDGGGGGGGGVGFLLHTGTVSVDPNAAVSPQPTEISP